MKNLTGNSISRLFYSTFFNIVILAVILFVPMGIVYAVNTATGQPPCPTGQLCNPIGSSTLDDFVVKITAAALKIGVPIAALFIMWAGFKFVTARGDKTGIEDARNIFWYTIIGTAILLAASLLARVLTATITQIQA